MATYNSALWPASQSIATQPATAPRPRLTDRSFQMMARYLPGSRTPLDPNWSPNSTMNKYGGDWTKHITSKGPEAAAMWQQWLDEVGPGIDTYAKFLAKYPGGQRAAAATGAPITGGPQTYPEPPAPTLGVPATGGPQTYPAPPAPTLAIVPTPTVQAGQQTNQPPTYQAEASVPASQSLGLTYSDPMPFPAASRLPRSPVTTPPEMGFSQPGVGGRQLGFADGGPIEGPGGPRQDNLLIAASNGEFVIPADVVTYKGKEFFDKLIDKTREATGGPQEGGLPPQPSAPPPGPLGFADGGLVTDPNEDLYLQPSGSAGLETLPALGDPPPMEALSPAPSLALGQPVPMSETEPIAPPAAPMGAPGAPPPTSGLGLATYKAARTEDDKTYLQNLPTAEKIGLMLESLGAGINGGPNPIDRLLDNKRKREVEFRNELRTNLATITTGMEAVRKLPPGKGREALIEQIVRSTGGDPAVAEALKAVGTEAEAQIRSTLSTIKNPRVQKMITDAVAGSANPREDALRLMGDNDFMKRAEAAADLDAMPGLTGKLRVISQAMEKMGLKTYTFAELAEQNGKLPKEFQLDDGEMAAAKRNQDGLQLFGLKSEKMLAEERAAASKRTEAEERSKDRKSEQENALRIAASLRAPTPPAPLESIMGPDGKAVLVPRDQAVGKTPAARSSGDRVIPAPVATAMATNDGNIRRAKTALALVSGEDVTMPGPDGKQITLKGDKEATGWKGYMPDALVQRWDESGVDARAAIGDLGSMVIHDRSGAAVTAAEFPRLRPFIPLPTDDNATVKKKLSRFVAEYTAINNELRGMFSADQGYRTADKAPDDGGEIGAKAKAAFGSYEPDKYTYGTNPKTGKFARKPK